MALITLPTAVWEASSSATTAAVAAPTLVTEGVAVPADKETLYVQVAVKTTVTSGTVKEHVRVFGWAPSIGSGTWVLLEDLHDGTATDRAASWCEGYPLSIGRAYSRLYAAIPTAPNAGGGSGTVATYFGFSG